MVIRNNYPKNNIQLGPIRTVQEFGACTPDQFAEVALKSFGTQSQVTPYWKHEAQLLFMDLIPEVLKNFLILKVGNEMRSLTEKARKKQ